MGRIIIIFVALVILINIFSSAKKHMWLRRVDNDFRIEAELDSTYRVGDTILMPINSSTQYKCVITGVSQ